MFKIIPCQISTTQESPSSCGGERGGGGGGGGGWQGVPLKKHVYTYSIYLPPKPQNFMLMIIL